MKFLSQIPNSKCLPDLISFLSRPSRALYSAKCSFSTLYRCGHSSSFLCPQESTNKLLKKVYVLSSQKPLFANSIHTSTARQERKILKTNVKNRRVLVVDLTEPNTPGHGSGSISDVIVKNWDPQRKEYETIYMTQLSLLKLSEIWGIATKSLLKVSVICSPLLMAASVVDMISIDEAISLTCSLGLLTFPFLSWGLIISRFVGQIKLSKDNKYVILSHINIFGRKRTIVATPNDLVPIKGSFSGRFPSKIVQIKKGKFSAKLLLAPGLSGSEPDIEAIDDLFSRKKEC